MRMLTLVCFALIIVSCSDVSVIDPESYSIEVLDPNPSTTWYESDSSTRVEWNYCPGELVRIEIWSNSVKVDDYSDWINNTGLYTRIGQLPTNWKAGRYYQVKVIDSDGYEGMSSYFVINRLPTYMNFVTIPSGSFNMGAASSEQGSEDDERPVHQVAIDYEFEIMSTEVTQRMWLEVMGNNPSSFPKEYSPVEWVSWTECKEFIEIIDECDANHYYRLPSEAEWEYACRAGSDSRFYWGNDPDGEQIEDYAWSVNNSLNRTHSVAQKIPNAWGLYDMIGNVMEWCEDSYQYSYSGAPEDGSAWYSGNLSNRVVRGGCWFSTLDNCRSAARNLEGIGNTKYSVGFRVVRVSN